MQDRMNGREVEAFSLVTLPLTGSSVIGIECPLCISWHGKHSELSSMCCPAPVLTEGGHAPGVALGNGMYYC
jgi:hypothetical protein